MIAADATAKRTRERKVGKIRCVATRPYAMQKLGTAIVNPNRYEPPTSAANQPNAATSRVYWPCSPHALLAIGEKTRRLCTDAVATSANSGDSADAERLNASRFS